MTPASEILARLKAAKPGDVVATGPVVVPDQLRMVKMDFGGVTLDATGALFIEGAAVGTVRGLNMKAGTWGTAEKDTAARSAIEASNVEDFSVSGALFHAGPGGDRAGLKISGGKRVTARDNLFFGHRTGLSLQQCEDFLATRNAFRRMISDGLNIVNSHRGIVSENDCEWHVRVGSHHPDGIQIFSHKGRPICSNIYVINNRLVGMMQAILASDPKTGAGEFLFFHGNLCWVAFSHTITVGAAMNCTATHNVLASHPGALFGANPGKLKGFDHPSNTVRDNIMWPGTVNPPPRIWWNGTPDLAIGEGVGSRFDDRRYKTQTLVAA